MNRVVVTGMGAVTPIGLNSDLFWEGLRSEKCGVSAISRFDASRLPCQVAAEIKDFNPGDYFDVRTANRIARFTQFALVAAREAIQKANLPERLDSDRAAIILGNCIGGLEVHSDAEHRLFEKGPSRIPAMTIPKMIANEAAGNLSMEFGIHGMSHTVTTACASGTDALGHAVDLIRLGKADIVLTGGTESTIVEFGIGGFCAIKALSTGFNATPEKASRPFDKDRDGFVMGEGAGILVFESLESALKRGATIFAEVGGWSATSDAYHLTAPNPEGKEVARAVREAIADAGLTPADIDYVNAHGTSTPTNDPLETKAIKLAFGDEVSRIRVSSIKGHIGHTLGAAGALEGIACVKAINDGFYPPTLHLENPDPLCNLDYVPNHGVNGSVRVALSLSLGFGGHNSAIVFKEFKR